MIESHNLKDQAFYEDLYDWHTVQECRRWIRLSSAHEVSKEKLKGLKRKEQIRLKANLASYPLYFIKGNRYIYKKEFIDDRAI